MTIISPSADSPPFRRVAAIDVLRGLLMVIMALDHTRDFFSNANVDPTNPLTSWPALFFTRWITHLCAPGFVALAGTSIYLHRLRGRTHNYVAIKLVTRGLWLIFLEVTVVSFSILFTYKLHFLQVIYTIGGSMVLLAALQYLPTKFVAAYGILIVTLHNFVDTVPTPHFAHAVELRDFLMTPGAILSHGQTTIVLYPLLPWSGIMALGYAFGAVVNLPPHRRRSLSILFGSLLLATLTGLRLTHSYGDPVPFEVRPTVIQSAMSFFQVTKYPPSLHYVLATFGFLLLLFALADYALEHRWLPRLAAIFEIYGRVPFFYYVIHFFIIHIAMVFTLMAFTHTLHPTLFGPRVGTPPPGWGFGLPIVYAIWFCVVASLYYPCKWFAGVKSSRRDWWLSYL
jgi:uncharacterized membrane protein